MRVFVTGATGHIGLPVVQRLLAGGHQVVGLARTPASAAVLAAAGARAHRGDLRDPASVAAAVDAADAVVHTGFVREGDLDAGIAGDRAFTDLALDRLAGTGRTFVYTTNILGTGDRVVAEDDAWTPPPWLAWRAERERAVLAAVAAGVRGVVVRPPIVHGRGHRDSGGDVVGRLLRAARDAGQAFHIGAGANRISSVHVDDLADAYARVLTRGPAGLYHVVAGEPVTMREVAAAIAVNLRAGAPVGWTLEQGRGVFGPAAEAFTLDMRIRTVRTPALLGWTPTGPGLLDDLARGSYRAPAA